MKTEKPIKKGFFGILKESFTKSGGCCGAGETCARSEGRRDRKPTSSTTESPLTWLPTKH